MKNVVFLLILVFFVSCSSNSSKIDDDTVQNTDDSSTTNDLETVDVADEGGFPDIADTNDDLNDEEKDDPITDEEIPDTTDQDNEVPDENSCLDPIETPVGILTPQPGELFYIQIGLAGISMGESAVIVGPDGTITLVDAGNDSHDKDIADIINNLITQMNSNGFTNKAQNEIDNVIITHFHADHSDGLQDLMKDITVKEKVIHRGFFDITQATDTKTVTQLCDTLEDNPGKELALCTGALRSGCNDWSSTLPSTGCPILGTDEAQITMGEQSSINIFAVNGYISDGSYATDVQPFLTEDSNGENARSVSAVVENGNFKLLFAGDLTGGGSDTDPVEGFYAGKLAEVTNIDNLGVDILHAGHHGRNTSSSVPWINKLLPNDGKSRNMIMGISTAHINSPHQETLDTVFSGNRLNKGTAWTTTVATGGATHADLINAFGGNILIQTEQNGKIYHIQAVDSSGNILFTKSFYSVKGCK